MKTFPNNLNFKYSWRSYQQRVLKELEGHEGAVKQIAQVLLESLKHLREVKTDWSNLKVVAEYDGQGAVYCSLDGATYFESSLFKNALQEILGLIGNPRYLISEYQKDG